MKCEIDSGTCKVDCDEGDAGVEDRQAACDAAFVAGSVHNAARHGSDARHLAQRVHGQAGDDKEDDTHELLGADADEHVGAHGLGDGTSDESKHDAAKAAARAHEGTRLFPIEIQV